MSSASEILTQALALPLAERAEIAHQLMTSLETEPPDAEWAEAWAKELDKRDEAVENGTAVLYDLDEVFARIRKSLEANRVSP
jgi:putative addiction module component (TIGR02574 family)